MLSLFQRSGLSFERLKSFCSVVDAGGISPAAPGDPNRQSQFSRQIKELEEFFGTRLIHRKRGRFELTAAGVELHSIAESHFRALDNLLRREADQTIFVRIGGGESVLHGILLPLLPRLQSRLPNITLELFNCRTAETLSRLKDGRIDFGLLLDAVDSADIETQIIGKVRFGVFLPESVKIPTSRVNAWKLLQKLPVASLAGSRSVERLRKIADEKGVDIQTAFLGSSYAQVVEASKLLGCLAMVPDFFVTAQTRGTFFPIEPGEELARNLSIAWAPRNLRLNSHGTMPIQELKQLISEFLSELPMGTSD